MVKVQKPLPKSLGAKKSAVKNKPKEGGVAKSNPEERIVKKKSNTAKAIVNGSTKTGLSQKNAEGLSKTNGKITKKKNIKGGPAKTKVKNVVKAAKTDAEVELPVPVTEKKATIGPEKVLTEVSNNIRPQDAKKRKATKNVEKAEENVSNIVKLKKVKKEEAEIDEEQPSEEEVDKKVEEQYVAPAFNIQNFRKIVASSNIERIVTALKKQVEEEVKAKKNLIFSDYHYFLDVISFKIPNCPKRIVKLNLINSIVNKDSDIAIIVPDLKRGRKVDYEPTIQHYEEKFREAGFEQLHVIPFNKFRNECTNFEAIRKFSNTYDYFLCDGRIVGHMTGLGGKIFQKPRKAFHSVNLEGNNWSKELNMALHRTAYRQISKGNMISIPVANHNHTPAQVADNIADVVKQLRKLYGGGWENIRSMFVKIDIIGTSSLPIYISFAAPPDNTPYKIGPREIRMNKLKKEANAVLTNFTITKDAHVIKLTPEQREFKRKLIKAREELNVALNEGTDADESQDSSDAESDDNEPPKKSRKAKESSKSKEILFAEE